MAEVNIINVEVTPQAPINVETQTKSVNVQVGNDAALGAVTQGVIDLHKKVDDLANKQVDVDLTPVAKESTLTSAKEEIIEAVENSKVKIDTSGLAKQGENPEATNSAILEAVRSIDIASALNQFDENLATQLQSIIGEV